MIVCTRTSSTFYIQINKSASSPGHTSLLLSPRCFSLHCALGHSLSLSLLQGRPLLPKPCVPFRRPPLSGGPWRPAAPLASGARGSRHLSLRLLAPHGAVPLPDQGVDPCSTHSHLIKHRIDAPRVQSFWVGFTFLSNSPIPEAMASPLGLNLLTCNILIKYRYRKCHINLNLLYTNYINKVYIVTSQLKRNL